MTADQKRTKTVKELWTAISGQKWPKGWRINWHVAGMTIPLNETIYLSLSSVRDSWDLEIVVHELVHMENPKLKHGKLFDARVRKYLKEAKKWCQETKKFRLTLPK